METTDKPTIIFTDGACSGNPGPGGWAAIVALPDGNVHELGGAVPDTTNNRMELAATIRALSLLEAGDKRKILLYTDSKYVIQGITQWIFGWRSRGWKSAEGKDVANRELWEVLLRETMRLKPSVIEWLYVRGHAGYAGNERCDEIAVSFSKNKPEQLYVGSVDGYFVDLTHLPVPESIEDSKSSGKSGSTKSGGSSKSSAPASGPVTYLSYHNGVLQRHASWSECERRVKGQSGAKFKKVKSPQEERETLAGWGLK